MNNQLHHDRLIAARDRERRVKRRFPIEQDVLYKMLYGHRIAETGVGQIMMGTDYPFPWTDTSVDHILNTPGLSDDDRIAMLGGTAARLLGID